MADLFRSAFNYVQQHAAPLRPATGSPSSTGASHPLVGTTVDIGDFRVKLKSLIAEGGFGLVFAAQDAAGRWYALKRLLAHDKDGALAASREIKFQRDLSGHPNIVKFVASTTKQPTPGRVEYYLLTELCSGGSVIEAMLRGQLNPENVFKIFYATSHAVKHMHDRSAPITHRDIKVENLLFTSQGQVKLCDFGSSTSEVWRPDDSWNALRRSLLEEEMQKHTTPMYRAPEILDTYQNYAIGPSQDIWALGCILYYMCYRVHPFEDSAKLRIINAKYTFPKTPTPHAVFNPIIQSLLQPNPHLRPSIQELCTQLDILAQRSRIDPSKPITGLDVGGIATGSSSNPDVSTPTQPSAGLPEDVPVAGSGAEMLAQLKGQGLNIFKNIRDKSAAVVQSVQSTYGSKGPDVTWITSRLAIAPLNTDNVPEAIAALSEEQLKNYIVESSAKRPFVVFNLSERELKSDYNRCASEKPLPPLSSGVAPSLDYMISLCANSVTFLKRDPKNIVFFTGNESQCVLVAACLMTYCQLNDSARQTVEAIRDMRRGSAFYFPPSYLRLVDIFSTVASCASSDELKVMVHNAPVKLNCLYIEPVPTFNNARTGCRPYVDVYCGGKKMWSTLKSYEDAKMHEAHATSSISIDLESWPVNEDVQVVAYHARWSRIQNRLQPVLMFGCGFHANFIDGFTDHLAFEKEELDVNGPDGERALPPGLKVLLSVSVAEEDRGFQPRHIPEFLKYNSSDVKLEWLIGCEDDNLRVRQALSAAASKLAAKPKPPRPPPPPGASVPLVTPSSDKPPRVIAENSLDDPFTTIGTVHAPPVHQQAGGTGFDDFFSSLNWESVPAAAPAAPTPVQATSTALPPTDAATQAERLAGIRVATDEPEADDADLYKFDYEKTPQPASIHAQQKQRPADDTEKLIDDIDDFSFEAHDPPPRPPPRHQSKDPFGDLLGGGGASMPIPPMHRNVSAPVFPDAKKSRDDVFAGMFDSTHGKSANNSGRSTPLEQNQPKKASTLKNTNDIFGDILADQGFTHTAKKPTTIHEMKKVEENKYLDPVAIKVRNWKDGKNGNIRALLASLDEVLWEDAGTWTVPQITDMLSDRVVKKVYFRACLLVHPDKQVDKPHYKLAQAIFTELNLAMKDFEDELKADGGSA